MESENVLWREYAHQVVDNVSEIEWMSAMTLLRGRGFAFAVTSYPDGSTRRGTKGDESQSPTGLYPKGYKPLPEPEAEPEKPKRGHYSTDQPYLADVDPRDVEAAEKPAEERESYFKGWRR